MGILGGQPEAKDKAELDLVAAFVDPVVSGKANQQKGSTCPRSDAPTEFQRCLQPGGDGRLDKPNGSVQNPFNVITGDWNNGIWTAMYNFWCDKNQTDGRRRRGPQGRVRRHLRLSRPGNAALADEAKAIFEGRPATVGCRPALFGFSSVDVESLEPGPL